MSTTDQDFKVQIFSRDGQDTVGHRLVVYKFSVADLDDPDVHAAEHLINWEKSEAGEWVMSRALETPEWIRQHELTTCEWSFCIIAWLSQPDTTFYKLKFL